MIQCKILSLENTTIYKEVKSIELPALRGKMQILQDHAESFIALNSGNLVIKSVDEDDKILKISGGECHVKDNNVIIIL